MFFKYLILTTLFGHSIMINTDYCHKDGPLSLPLNVIVCNQQDKRFKQWKSWSAMSVLKQILWFNIESGLDPGTRVFLGK